MTWPAMIQNAITTGVTAVMFLHAIGEATYAHRPKLNLDAIRRSDAAESSQAAQREAVPVSDVALGSGGQLTGMVVDTAGLPVKGAGIVLLRDGREVARSVSDAEGRFQVLQLHGGVYQIRAAGGGSVYRLWAPATSPPTASAGATIVARGEVVRGQIRYRDLFASDKVLFGGVVAGAMAIPVAIYNNHGSGS